MQDPQSPPPFPPHTLAACLLGIAAAAATALHPHACAAADAAPAGTAAAVLGAARAADWRRLDPQDTLYIELPQGRVVVELAPAFAPNHVANIKALAREHYYDDAAVVRTQDNYLVQISDPNAKDEARRKPIRSAKASLPAEFTAPWSEAIPFAALPDADGYAPEVGFSGGFPAARDRKAGRAWLPHCYGTFGVGRLNTPDSGSGAELYVTIGTPPRQLDRNTTVAGRVVQGMELLSALPRGSNRMGGYDRPEKRPPVLRIRVAADVPEAERTALEVLRTDTPTFRAWVESQRNRREPFYVAQAGHVDVCNLSLPVRAAESAP